MVPDTLGVLPWFLPGVALSMAIALIVCRPVDRRLGVGAPVTWALIVGLGVVVSATLIPLRGSFDFEAAATGTCDFSRVGLAPIAQVIRVGDTSLNIALFIPLGIAVGLVPPTAKRPALILASLALPLAIETIQLLAPILDRGCQSADVVDNLTGLLIGVGIGATLRLLSAKRR